MTFACVSEDFHPYECDGPGKCRHCDRREIQSAHDPQGGGHNPEICELCADTPRAVVEDWEAFHR